MWDHTSHLELARCIINAWWDRLCAAMTPTTAPADRSVLAIAAPEIQQLPEEDDEKPVRARPFH